MEIVEPDYNDFVESPTIRRSRAIIASLLDFMQWRWHEIIPGDQPSWREYKTGLIATCGSIGLLNDIYETFKHRGLNRPETSIAVTEMPVKLGRGGAGGYGTGSGGYGVGSLAYGSGIFEPVVHCGDGSRRWLVDVVAEVRGFWLLRRGESRESIRLPG